MDRSMDRRHFIKLGTVAATGAVAAGALAQAAMAEGSDSASSSASVSATSASGSASASAASASSSAAPATATVAAKPSYAIAPEAVPDADIAETIESDIVVVGAGMSGLCTALSALENGATSVTVVAASDSPVSRGGSNNAPYSKFMKEKGVPPMDITKALRKEYLANCGSVDVKKWAKYFQNAETTCDWLIDIMDGTDCMCDLECTAPYGEDDVFYTAPCSHAWEKDSSEGVARMQTYVVNAIADKIVADGGRIDYQNIAKQLVRGGVANGTTGRVDAVITQRADGTYAKYVGHLAVVLATGDFSLDREMMQDHCPEAMSLLNQDAMDADVDYSVSNMGTGGLFKGDGHKMGLWVGAAWQHNPHNCPMYIAVGTACTPNYALYCGLLLNSKGERFMNEDVMFAQAAPTIMGEPGAIAYGIWDDDYASYWTDWHTNFTTYFSDPMTEDDIRAMWTNSFDTIEDAINDLGLPLDETKAAIDRYNELCDGGADTDFFKTADKMHAIVKPPFHTGFQGPQFLTILGGLRTDENLRVCDENDNPIPGLYNVGTMVGDFYGGIYTYMIEGFNYGQCRTLGYMTGKYIAENEDPTYDGSDLVAASSSSTAASAAPAKEMTPAETVQKGCSDCHGPNEYNGWTAKDVTEDVVKSMNGDLSDDEIKTIVDFYATK